MATLDNPAGRLYEILNSVRKIRHRAIIEAVWGDFFAVEDRSEIFIRLVELMNLVDRAKKSIQQLQDVNQALYLHPFENIERALSFPNLKDDWQEVKQFLDDTTMTQLEFCSELLSRRGGEKVISDEELTELQTKVESLLKEVLDSTLPLELTAVVTQKLEDIRQAILAYRITGNEGLRRAVENGLGAIVLSCERLPEIQDEEQKRTLRDVIEFMAHVAQIGGFVLQATQLTAPFIALLGSGGS